MLANSDQVCVVNLHVKIRRTAGSASLSSEMLTMFQLGCRSKEPRLQWQRFPRMPRLMGCCGIR